MADHTTRRDFLKTTAGAAATLGALGYTRSAGANDRLSIGIIGCGSRGMGAHMPPINHLAKEMNVEITAVCDPWGAHRREAAAMCKDWFGIEARQYTSYKELLDQKDIDMVCIASCDHQHSTMLQHAAEAKKDAYCEKPLAKESRRAEGGLRCSQGEQRNRAGGHTDTQQSQHPCGKTIVY
jgi:hypothetical protein